MKTKTSARVTQGQRNAIIEECAKVCDKGAKQAEAHDSPKGNFAKGVAKMLAYQIRALKTYGGSK